MRVKRRIGLLILIIALGWVGTVMAQNTPATKETLLDELSTLWSSYNRQPTPEEINENGAYKSDLYLREWETWDAVQLALADHVYQQGLFAKLQGNNEAAINFYRLAISTNPNHEAAKAALKSASDIEVDIEEAQAQKRPVYSKKSRRGRL